MLRRNRKKEEPAQEAAVATQDHSESAERAAIQGEDQEKKKAPNPRPFTNSFKSDQTPVVVELSDYTNPVNGKKYCVITFPEGKPGDDVLNKVRDTEIFKWNRKELSQLKNVWSAEANYANRTVAQRLAADIGGINKDGLAF